MEVDSHSMIPKDLTDSNMWPPIIIKNLIDESNQHSSMHLSQLSHIDNMGCNINSNIENTPHGSEGFLNQISLSSIVQQKRDSKISLWTNNDQII